MRRLRTARVARFLVPCVLAVVVANGSPASANSRVVWQRLFSRPEGGNAAFIVRTAPDGSAVYVTGVVSDRSYAIETIAYDPANGDTLWEARYTGEDGDAYPGAMTVSPDGHTVFVTGETDTNATQADWVTIAYGASDGAQRWVSIYGGADPRGNDYAEALAVSPDNGTLFVTGLTWQGTPVNEVPTTVAYDTSSGTTRWGTWDATAHYGAGRYIAVSPDGSRVDVTAAFSVDGDTQLTRTYSYGTASGNEAWASTFRGGSAGSETNAMTLAPDGSHVYLAVGVLTGETAPEKIAAISYDASTGSREWKVQTAGATGLGASPSGIAVTPDGSQVLISGDTTRWAKRYADLLWSVDAATGTTQWRRVHRHEEDAFDITTALVISPDGSTAYVSGMDCAGTLCDGFPRAWDTLAFSLPGGVLQWSARFSPPGTDNRAFAIAVTPDSTKVVVVGDSYSQDSDNDSFATIVYAA